MGGGAGLEEGSDRRGRKSCTSGAVRGSENVGVDIEGWGQRDGGKWGEGEVGEERVVLFVCSAGLVE